MQWKTMFLAALFAVCVTASASAAKYKVVEVTDGGAIMGQVTFDGTPPEPAIEMPAETKPCHIDGSRTRMSARIEVGKSGGVKNTVVFLKEVSKGKAFPTEEPILDQQRCTFVPHVVIVEQREELKIRNSDATLHNVHGYLGKTDVFNLAMPTKDHVVGKKMRRPGIISVKCDAGHTWMSAYVFVVEHPYYAVTDEEGKFKLENVPPGKYTLVVWHEGWEPKNDKYEASELEVPVEVSASGKIEMNFALKSDAKITKK